MRQLCYPPLTEAPQMLCDFERWFDAITLRGLLSHSYMK